MCAFCTFNSASLVSNLFTVLKSTSCNMEAARLCPHVATPIQKEDSVDDGVTINTCVSVLPKCDEQRRISGHIIWLLIYHHHNIQRNTRSCQFPSHSSPPPPFDLLRGIWQQVDRVGFRRGQGGAEGRDDVHIDFPALEEAVWRHVQSARLLVWNVWRAMWVLLKCARVWVCAYVCVCVKIAVAVQMGVSVWHHSGLGYVQTGQT